MPTRVLGARYLRGRPVSSDVGHNVRVALVAIRIIDVLLKIMALKKCYFSRCYALKQTTARTLYDNFWFLSTLEVFVLECSKISTASMCECLRHYVLHQIEIRMSAQMT